jgi:TetR/AcrR family transcriptional regulator, ethionamide resistance regulator
MECLTQTVCSIRDSVSTVKLDASTRSSPAGSVCQPKSTQAVSGRKRREASANEILAAIQRLLATGGPVAKLSVDRIVAEAGVSRATFYACFSDKHAAIGSLAQEALAWREEISAEVLADSELTHARLDDLMRAIVAHWQANRPVLAAIIELAEHDPAMREPWRAAVNEIAEQAAEQFRLRWDHSPDQPANPDAMATVFTWMLERCCHQLVTDDASAETMALAMSEIIWRTLTYRVA